MAAKKVGDLVKEARTKAGLTQEKLAQLVGDGILAAEIGKCERKQADLTKEQLKKIAVACGVTQASLINAPKNLSATAAKAAAKATAAKTAVKAAKETAAKTTAAKTAAKTTAAKTAAKTTATKTTAKATAAKTAAKTTTAKAAAKPAAKKTAAASGSSMKVSAAEKKLIEAYREASSDNKKTALNVLKGEYSDHALRLLNLAGGGDPASAVGDALGSLLGSLTGGK